MKKSVWTELFLLRNWRGKSSILSTRRSSMIKFGKETVDAQGWTQQQAQLGALCIHLAKSPKATSSSAELLPSKVTKDGQVLWSFDKSYIDCIAFLREVDGEHMIVYATRQEVVDIVPILDLPNTIRLAGGQYDWKRSALERLQLKLAAAERMSLDCRLTPIEKILNRKLDEQKREAAAAQSAALAEERQREHEARLAARAERKRQIMMRERITVYTSSGEKRKGVPVVDDEWQALGDGVDCVRVASYADGIASEPSELFFVKKEGSRKSRQRIVPVFAEDPTKPSLVEKMGEIVVEIDGVPDAISCFTRDGLASLKADGLNSGAIRGVWPANADGTYTLVSFAKGGTRDIGNFLPVT